MGGAGDGPCTTGPPSASPRESATARVDAHPTRTRTTCPLQCLSEHPRSVGVVGVWEADATNTAREGARENHTHHHTHHTRHTHHTHLTRQTKMKGRDALWSPPVPSTP